MLGGGGRRLRRVKRGLGEVGPVQTSGKQWPDHLKTRRYGILDPVQVAW